MIVRIGIPDMAVNSKRTGFQIIRDIIRFLSWVDCVVCLVLAYMFTASPFYLQDEAPTFSSMNIARFLGYLLVFLLLAGVFRYLFSAVFPRYNNTSRQFAKINSFLEGKRAVLYIALIMLAFWMPTLICLYPGTAINDTWGQLQEFMRAFQNGRIYLEFLEDHHPVVTTWIIGQIIVPLARIFDNWQLALFLYVILQAFLTCLSFAAVLVYCHRKLGISAGWIFVMFLAFVCLPIFPVSAQTISKDAMFSWIYVLFSIMFIEIVRTGGSSLKFAGNSDLFLILCLACCLTKKVAFYVFIPSLIVAACAFRAGRKKIIITIGACVLIMKVLLPFVITVGHIMPGQTHEMFSVPFQMTARYMKYHGDDITEDEYAAIDKVLDMNGIAERYNPRIADPVKGWVERGNKSDYIGYLNAWVKMGLRHPESYWDALMAMESGWVSWMKYIPLMDMNWHDQLNTSMIPESVTKRVEPFDSLANRYGGMTDTLYKIPVLKIFISYGLYASLIPAFIFTSLIFTSRKRRDCSWIAGIPIFLSIVLGCWLSPVSAMAEGLRYLYPLTYTAILNLAWCGYQLYMSSKISVRSPS